MSAYDSRSTAQIILDEIIYKYKTRIKEIEFYAKKYKEDEELLKQLNLLVSDLHYLKSVIDETSYKGDKNEI